MRNLLEVLDSNQDIARRNRLDQRPTFLTFPSDLEGTLLPIFKTLDAVGLGS